MGIDEALNAVLWHKSDQLDQRVDELFVVDTWSRMLKCLPWDEQANKGQPPSLEPRKVLVSLISREGSTEEAHVPMIKKAFIQVSAAIGSGRELGVTAEVDASHQQCPVL